MAIYDFFVSRNNQAITANAYVGHQGRLFYDDVNGLIRISDGVTPGGNIVQNPAVAISSTTPPPNPFEGMLWFNPVAEELWAYYNGAFQGTINPATETKLGGIKAGPGANVSVDGTLTINTAGLPLSFGDFTANVNILTMVNSDQNMVLATQGSAEIQLAGNIGFYKTNGLPPTVSNRYFYAQDDGQIMITVPSVDSVLGAVEIIGSTTGNTIAPGITGAMLHVTGQLGIPCRNYYDGNGNYVSWVARRWNGNVAVPTQVMAGEDVLRINATAATDAGVGNVSLAQISMTALENQTTTAQGSSITFTVTPVGSPASARVAVANVTVAEGLTVTKATVQGNLTVGNVYVNTSGTVTTPRVVFNDGGVRSISGGTAATIDFAADSLVLWYIPSGTATVTLSNYRAGAVVRLHIRIGGTSRDINYGVAAADNSSTGSTSFNGSGFGSTDISDTTMQLVYTCYDGTAANTYVAVTTV